MFECIVSYIGDNSLSDPYYIVVSPGACDGKSDNEYKHSMECLSEFH